MPVQNSRLAELIRTITYEMGVAKEDGFLAVFPIEDGKEAVNQLIELTGNAILALGIEGEKIKLDVGNYQFTLSAKLIKKKIPYLYRITCIHPTKCRGMVYYGKHQSKNPEKSKYMGGGDLIKIAQDELGMKYFTKHVVSVFSDIESAEKAEEIIVNADFVGRLNNFNLALGGHQVSIKDNLEASLAHPLKYRLVKWFRDKKEAKRNGVPVWLYRKRIAEEDQEFFDMVNLSRRKTGL